MISNALFIIILGETLNDTFTVALMHPSKMREITTATRVSAIIH